MYFTATVFTSSFIIGYSVGNLTSISNMLEKVGLKGIISNNAKGILEVRKIILSEVRSVEHGIDRLKGIDSLQH